jgi:hypothetical protein
LNSPKIKEQKREANKEKAREKGSQEIETRAEEE